MSDQRPSSPISPQEPPQQQKAAEAALDNDPCRAVHRIQTETSHAAAYVDVWCISTTWCGPAIAEVHACLLVAAGRGPARLPTCDIILHRARPKFRGASCDSDRAVVERTLSLFGCGELRALRVVTADVFRLVLSMMQSLPDGGVPSSRLSQALGSVRVIQLTELPAYEDDQVNAATVIERCAAAVTELKGRLPHHLVVQVRPLGASARACTLYSTGGFDGSFPFHTRVVARAFAASHARVRGLRASLRYDHRGGAATAAHPLGFWCRQ
jgi:hypothetical protein